MKQSPGYRGGGVMPAGISAIQITKTMHNANPFAFGATSGFNGVDYDELRAQTGVLMGIHSRALCRDGTPETDAESFHPKGRGQQT